MSLITCPSCGAAISESAKFCPNCGATISYSVNNQQNKPACPETYLARAILVTIICCWPFGIPAIVNAVGVSNAYAAGDYQLAKKKSEDAKKWSNYAMIAAVVFWILYIILIAAGVAGGWE